MAMVIALEASDPTAVNEEIMQKMQVSVRSRSLRICRELACLPGCCSNHGRNSTRMNPEREGVLRRSCWSLECADSNELSGYTEESALGIVLRSYLFRMSSDLSLCGDVYWEQRKHSVTVICVAVRKTLGSLLTMFNTTSVKSCHLPCSEAYGAVFEV